MAKQAPKERWEALKATLPKDLSKMRRDESKAVLDKMDVINKDTLWGLGIEPEWWLDMMNFHRGVSAEYHQKSANEGDMLWPRN